jgi:hypothetical protein
MCGCNSDVVNIFSDCKKTAEIIEIPAEFMESINIKDSRFMSQKVKVLIR